jgi:hypothetical protein
MLRKERIVEPSDGSEKGEEIPTKKLAKKAEPPGPIA